MGAGMPELAQLPTKERAPQRDSARAGHVPRFNHRFYAFLSYSHQDQQLADWLHRELESFRVPRPLAGRLTSNGVVPRRLAPIFRDQHDLSAAGDLGEEIEAALAASQFLIVLCSPVAAKSRWVNAEIEEFKRSRAEGCILAAVAAGEPFASDIPGREDEECFPAALRHRYDRRGRPTARRAEPLAADFRGTKEVRRLAFLKLVAGMLGVGLDELVQRETTRRQRRMGYLAAASLAGMAVTSILAVTAIQARDEARDQRREAEGLIGFMLGDLKDKLQPIGKLDALDGVGSRVLDYYQKVGTSDLSDAALSQRSQALSLMAEVANLRGDTQIALRLYGEAAAGTDEAVERSPDDPQRLFNHAQNVFWIGELARHRGELTRAERAFQDYRRLADRMIAIEPNNMKWRMEVQYAEANLGVVLYEQRRFAAAEGQFQGALRTIEAIAAVDPNNRDYQKSVSLSLAWLADAQLGLGKLRQAIESRSRQVALLERLQRASADVAYRELLIPAQQALGRLQVMTGRTEEGIGQLRGAVAQAESLVPNEPNNTVWLSYAASAKLGLAEALLASRNSADAAAHTQSACGTVGKLLAKNANVVSWRALLRTCLQTRAELAAQARDDPQALSLAEKALAAARSTHTEDEVADRFAIARAYRLIGGIRQRAGNAAEAKQAWEAAFRVLPQRLAEKPAELSERAALLDRLGRRDEARQIAARLSAMGYRPIAV